MYKVVIVDDEPKVRRKLIHSIDWSALDLEIAGEAEDGLMAFEMATEHMPSIMFVDICIPFFSGLELIDRLRERLPDCLFIVITGHDEFDYAQQSIRLSVFDYLLKPVRKEQLLQVVFAAKEQVSRKELSDRYMNWAGKQLKKNVPFLKERFWDEWVNGLLQETEVDEQLSFLSLEIPTHFGMMMLKVADKGVLKHGGKEWDQGLLLFAIQNVAEELVGEQAPCMSFRDRNNHLVIITKVAGWEEEWAGLGDRLIVTVERCFARTLVVKQETGDQGKRVVPRTYMHLLQEMKADVHRTPVVLHAQKYIDRHYHEETLSLQDVSEKFQISPAYLSRLLRQELGMSFIDYLTQVRIRTAARFLNDPEARVYEVSERVGYSSQHYFSVAFKKVVGVSPTDYRKGGSK